jgi:hypothetical protein
MVARRMPRGRERATQCAGSGSVSLIQSSRCLLRDAMFVMTRRRFEEDCKWATRLAIRQDCWKYYDAASKRWGGCLYPNTLQEHPSKAQRATVFRPHAHYVRRFRLHQRVAERHRRRGRRDHCHGRLLREPRDRPPELGGLLLSPRAADGRRPRRLSTRGFAKVVAQQGDGSRPPQAGQPKVQGGGRGCRGAHRRLLRGGEAERPVLLHFRRALRVGEKQRHAHELAHFLLRR